MKEKLRITSRLDNTQFVAKTIINGTWYVLTENFIMMSAAEFESNPAHNGENVLIIEFTPQNKIWEFEYDTEDKPLSARPKVDVDDPDSYDALNRYEQDRETNEMNRRKRIAVREFFSRHMQLEQGTDFGNGHTPTSDPVGIVEIVTQKSRLMHLADRKKTKVFSIVDAMTWQEQYDLALYYAPELANKRRSEVLHGLIGLKGIGTREAYLGGKMWQKTDNGKMTYADDFLQNYANNPTVVMKIYVNKALAYGIIIKNTNGLYLNGTTFVGRDADDAVIYFSKDIDSYANVIQPEVNRLSKLPEDDLVEDKLEAYTKSSFATKKQNEQSTVAYAEHYKVLLNEYEKLTGTKNNEPLKYNELQAEVERLRASKALGEPSEGPTAKLAAAIDPLNSDDMNILKEYAKQVGVPAYQAYKSAAALKDKIKSVLSETA